MHIIVCIKSVIIRVPEGNKFLRSPETLDLNPFDRPALEVALRMKKEQGGTVTAISMGPDTSKFSLFEAMSMGVDRGILISDSALVGSDTLITSKVLSAAIKKLNPFDIVLFGTMTADSDTGQVPYQTSVLLRIPLISGVVSYQIEEKNIKIERRIDEFHEKFSTVIPAAFTIRTGSFQVRDIELKGLEKAFENGKIEKWNLKDLGINSSEVGEKASPTKVISIKRISKSRKCEFIPGTSEEQAEELINRLSSAGLIQ
ncbi:MAG: electron transfer flavoprotein subunit beta/FixA family protein [Desulfobacterales bacterium]|nr:electron transfer flavoprotein subunit beta/FixA family protein [Desulfobacterales bacterium]